MWFGIGTGISEFPFLKRDTRKMVHSFTSYCLTTRSFRVLRTLDLSNIGMTGSNPALGMDVVSRFTVETLVGPSFLSERNV